MYTHQHERVALGPRIRVNNTAAIPYARVKATQW